MFILVSFAGIAVISAGIVLYGDILWDPLSLIDRWDNRAAAFFASASFVLATLGTKISTNSLSAANDMTVLFPRYINIRRGQVICAIFGGWALCPWEILASAQGFLSFMNGYTVFLGPFAGIMVADVGPPLDFASGITDAVRDISRAASYVSPLSGLLCVAADKDNLLQNWSFLCLRICPEVYVGGAFKIFDFVWIFGVRTTPASMLDATDGAVVYGSSLPRLRTRLSRWHSPRKKRSSPTATAASTTRPGYARIMVRQPRSLAAIHPMPLPFRGSLEKARSIQS